jgi:hypothetical protein
MKLVNKLEVNEKIIILWNSRNINNLFSKIIAFKILKIFSLKTINKALGLTPA